MVLPEFYPGDIRVSKEVDALEKAGYRMTIVCNRRKGQKKQEFLNKVTIRRVMGAATFPQKGLTDILTAIFFINPFFFFELQGYLKKGYMAVHVHDLPLMQTANMVFGKKIPIVVDMHENYPEALRVWFQWKKNPIIRLKNKLFFGFNRWSKYEKWAVQKADRVVAVVDEMKERFLAKQLFMSRGHFYRKVKTLTNQTVTQFIVRTKLKIAAPLLKTGELSISEIANEAGFSSQSYFTTICKREYGKTPKQLIGSDIG